MRSPEILNRTAIPVGMAFLLGITACGSEETARPISADCDKLTSVKLKGETMDGGLHLINSGQCANLYAGGTFTKIGEVKPQDPLSAICINYAVLPHAIAVRLDPPESSSPFGEVPLASNLLEDTAFTAALPNCNQFTA